MKLNNPLKPATKLGPALTIYSTPFPALLYPLSGHTFYYELNEFK